METITDFTFAALLNRGWEIELLTHPPRKEDHQSVLTVCPDSEFALLPDDFVMECAKTGEKKTKAEIALLPDEEKYHEWHREFGLMMWGVRSPPQSGVFFCGKFIPRKED